MVQIDMIDLFFDRNCHIDKDDPDETFHLQYKSRTRFKDVRGFSKKSRKTRRSVKSEILYQILLKSIAF